MAASKTHYLTPVITTLQTRYGNNRWEVYSRKLQRNVVLYSSLEYDHRALVESDPEILTFCEQPLKVRLQLPFGTVNTIFDMWIKWRNGGEEFREIKFRREISNNDTNSRVFRQIQAQRKWCELNDVGYALVTEEHIRGNLIYLKNCKHMLSYLESRNNISQALLQARVLDALRQMGFASLRDLESQFANEASGVRAAIFQLVIWGQIKADINSKTINLSTRLEIND